MNVVCHVTGDLHVLQCYYNNHECVFISLINTDYRYQSLSSLEGNPKQVVKQLPAQPQYASSSRAVLSEKMMRVSSTIQITLFSWKIMPRQGQGAFDSSVIDTENCHRRVEDLFQPLLKPNSDPAIQWNPFICFIYPKYLHLLPFTCSRAKVVMNSE